MRTTVALVVAFPASVVGCGTELPEEEARAFGSASDSAALAAAPLERELVFDREFLFISSSTDSLVAVPWFFRARSQVGGVLRERSAWVQREGTWESLLQESTSGPTSRTPWRILPEGSLRLVVGEGDGVEALLLRGGTADLETWLVEFLAEWTPLAAEPIRLFSGRTLFPSGPVEGFVLDLPRRWESPGAAPGDWIFLLAGPDLQIFLEEVPSPPDSRVATRYRGWSRYADGQDEWANVVVRWEDMRPFEEARRDIPSRWEISSPGGEISGGVLSSSSYLSAGEGEGPILPVTGLFAVSGALLVAGVPTEVEGVVRHVQH